MDSKNASKYLSILGFYCLSLILLSSCASSNNKGANARVKSDEITYKRNVERVRMVRIGSSQNKVEIDIVHTGAFIGASDPIDLLLQGSSGIRTNLSSNNLSYEDTQFPFKGKIDFKYAKEINIYYATVDYVINKPGHWLVTVHY